MTTPKKEALISNVFLSLNALTKALDAGDINLLDDGGLLEYYYGSLCNDVRKLQDILYKVKILKGIDEPTP